MWWLSDIKAPAASNGARSRPSRTPQHPWVEDIVSRADDDAVTDAAVRGWASAAADWDSRSGDEGQITGRGGAWVGGAEPSARRRSLTGKGGDAQGKGGKAGERGGAESGQSREEGELGLVVRADKRAGGENGGEGGGASQQGARRGGGADLEARIRRACEWVGVLPGGAPQIEGGVGRAAAIAGGSVGPSGITEILGSSLHGQDALSGRSDLVRASFQPSDTQRAGRQVPNTLNEFNAASGAANRAWEAGYELELLTAAWGEHLPVLLLDASPPSAFPARPCADDLPPPSAGQHRALRHAAGEARAGRREKSGAASGAARGGRLAEAKGGDGWEGGQQRGKGKRAGGSSGTAIAVSGSGSSSGGGAGGGGGGSSTARADAPRRDDDAGLTASSRDEDKTGSAAQQTAIALRSRPAVPDLHAGLGSEPGLGTGSENHLLVAGGGSCRASSRLAAAAPPLPPLLASISASALAAKGAGEGAAKRAAEALAGNGAHWRKLLPWGWRKGSAQAWGEARGGVRGLTAAGEARGEEASAEWDEREEGEAGDVGKALKQQGGGNAAVATAAASAAGPLASATALSAATTSAAAAAAAPSAKAAGAAAAAAVAGEARRTSASRNALAGGLAGGVVSVCIHPLDTVKTVLQAHRGSGAPSGVLAAVGRVVAEKGPLGLYSGVAASLATAAPISAIYACTYEAVKEALLSLVPQRLAPVAHCVAGAAASVATSAVFTPSEAVKQRMQTTTHFRSSLHALVGMARTEGVASLYGGLAAVLARNIPNSVIKLLVGGTAGSTAAFCTTPFDVVKTRLQTHLPGVPKYKGVVDAFSRIVREEGIGALYRGVAPRLLIYISQGAIFFASYELLRRLLLPPHSLPLHAPRSHAQAQATPQAHMQLRKRNQQQQQQQQQEE
ncbi:unnamed protein product [Closterium sp. NIES-54]